MNKKRLVAAAKEMNEVMGLKPLIKISLAEGPLIKNILKEANHPKDGVVVEDDLTDETWAVLAELGCPVAQGVVGEEPEEEDPEEEDPEEEELEEEEPEEEAAEELDLASMDLKALKAYIAEEELDIVVKKSAKAPAVRKLIEAALAELEEEEPEPEEEYEPAETPAEKKKREKKEKAEKDAAKKPAVKKDAKGAKTPSNKEVVFKAWKKGKGETDIAKLMKLTGDSVKEGTIKSWLNSWKAGNNLPACASK